MKKALIENGFVTFVSHNPEAIFGAEKALQFVECDDDVQVGWQAVNGVPVAPTPPTPAELMTAELAELARVYEEDTLGFQRRMATITLADGPTEATKIAAIRAQWQTRKTQYITDSAAVRAKYTTGV